MTKIIRAEANEKDTIGFTLKGDPGPRSSTTNNKGAIKAPEGKK